MCGGGFHAIGCYWSGHGKGEPRSTSNCRGGVLARRTGATRRGWVRVPRPYDRRNVVAVLVNATLFRSRGPLPYVRARSTASTSEGLGYNRRRASLGGLLGSVPQRAPTMQPAPVVILSASSGTHAARLRADENYRWGRHAGSRLPELPQITLAVRADAARGERLAEHMGLRMMDNTDLPVGALAGVDRSDGFGRHRHALRLLGRACTSIAATGAPPCGRRKAANARYQRAPYGSPPLEGRGRGWGLQSRKSLRFPTKPPVKGRGIG